MAAEFLLRAIFLLGAAFILSGPAERILQKFRMRNRLTERKRIKEGKKEWERKLDEAILIAFGKNATSELFLTIDGAVFLAAVLLAVRTFSAPAALLAGFGLAGIPWILFWLRLETKRRKGSQEGVTLLSELLRRYRISGKNIQTAIEETVAVPELKETGKLLYSLLLSLRDAKGHDAIRRATRVFSYGLGTNWGNMLAYNIAEAAETGKDIGPAMEDILVQLRDAEKLAEERKRMNGETARIINFFIPVLYPVSILVMRRTLDLTWETILHNQFGTTQGLLLFFGIVFLWAINAIGLSLVAGQKFDF